MLSDYLITFNKTFKNFQETFLLSVIGSQNSGIRNMYLITILKCLSSPTLGIFNNKFNCINNEKNETEQLSFYDAFF